MIIIGFDKNLTAFDKVTVGTKVLAQEDFIRHLTTAIENNFGLSGNFHSGVLPLPLDALPLVRTGVACLKILNRKEDFVVRKYRGDWCLFAHPRFAAKVDRLSCVVYNFHTYADDPEADEQHVAALQEGNTTHVLIAVLAAAGPEEAPLSSHRLVRNIAGGSKEWMISDDSISSNLNLLKRIHSESIKAVEYEKNWIVVADPEPDIDY